MKISERMTTDLITVSMDNTLGDIRNLFHENHCHHILVVSDSHKLLGVISDRDVLRNICPDTDSSLANNHSIRTLVKKAHQIMTRDVVTANPDDDLEKAAEIMLDKSLNCLPIVDQEDIACGIITRTDLLREFCEAKPATA